MDIVMEQKSAENQSTDKLASAWVKASIEASDRFVDQEALTGKTSCYLGLLLLEYSGLNSANIKQERYSEYKNYTIRSHVTVTIIK